VNQDDPDVIEFVNIVFIQVYCEYDGTYKPLSTNYVDAAIGFERLISVVQRLPSAYETDLFQPIIQKVQEISGVRAYRGAFREDDVDGTDTAYRVVVDHIRALAFSLCDGGVPSNEGRGYVLRRILRRGSWYARKKLNVPIGSFSSLLPTVVEHMVHGSFLCHVSFFFFR
jgi:alanyl-tRNA synthetase